MECTGDADPHDEVDGPTDSGSGKTLDALRLSPLDLLEFLDPNIEPVESTDLRPYNGFSGGVPEPIESVVEAVSAESFDGQRVQWRRLPLGDDHFSSAPTVSASGNAYFGRCI